MITLKLILSLSHDLIFHAVSEKRASLRNEDLCLSIVKINRKNSILDRKAVSGVEDVANNLTLIKAGVRYISVDLTFEDICKSNEEFASAISIDLVVNVLFIEEKVV